MRSSDLVVTLALVAATAACNSGSDSSPALAPASITDTFTGTVPVAGSDFHNFTVTQTGIVNITLTAVGPPPTITEGVGVGTPGSGICSVSPNDARAVTASTTAQLSGTLLAGTYCIEVFDIGNQAVDITYSVTVAHP